MSKRQRNRREQRRRDAQRSTRRLTAGTGLALGAAAFAPAAADAAAYTVSNLNDSGAGSLRQAIMDANATTVEDDVVFQSGLSGTIAVGPQMVINQPLRILGPGPDVVTLDGGGDARIIHVNTDADERTSISGLTMTDAAGNIGGAIFGYRGLLVLDDVALVDNVGSYGGGVYSYGDLTVTNSTITDNVVTNLGGGIGVWGAELTVANSLIADNEADRGGGVFANGLTEITDTTIAGNDATNNGGAAELRRGGHIARTTIADNTAIDDGGGLYLRIFDSDVDDYRLTNTTISGNTADRDGGGIFGYTDSYVVTPDGDVPATRRVRADSVTIAGNHAAGQGGGFAASARSLMCTTYNPTTMSYDCTPGEDVPGPVISNTLVGDNSADGGGGGSDVALGDDMEPFSGGFDLIEADPGGAFAGTSSVLGEDPQLDPLADNGGAVDTQAPRVGSPALDRGSTDLVEDARGFARPLDLFAAPNGEGSDASDIGAVEVVGDTQGPPPPPPPPQQAPPPNQVVTPPPPPPVLPRVQRCFGRVATIVATGARVVGTRARDVIVGTRGPDRIAGGGGNDLICTGGGADRVSGGRGKDRVSAGGGKDRASGGRGNDRLSGGRGNDRLLGGGGRDRLLGGPGRDILRGGPAKDTIIGGAGRDSCAQSVRAKRC